MKMRELMRIIVVCVCAFLLVVSTSCEDEVPETEEGTPRIEDQGDQRKDSKGLLPGKHY